MQRISSGCQASAPSPHKTDGTQKNGFQSVPVDPVAQTQASTNDPHPEVLELGYESSRDAYQCTDIPTPVWGRSQPSHCGEGGTHCQGKCQAMTQSSSFASEQACQA